MQTYTIPCPQEGYIPQNEIKLYVETAYNAPINAYIQEHYDQIQANLGDKQEGLMLYFPLLWEEMPEELIEFLTGHKPEQLATLSTAEVIRRLWPSQVIDAIQGPALLKYEMRCSRMGFERVFALTPLCDEQGNPTEALLQLAAVPEATDQQTEVGKNPDVAAENTEAVAENTAENEPFVPLEPAPEPEEWPADLFNADFWEEDDLTMKQVADALAEGYLTAEQQTKLEALQDNARSLISAGVSIQMVRLLAQSHNQLSSLQITEDHHIILPEFNNMEIPLAALQKTMFILFSQRPEGVSKADMPAMKDEIYELYRKISDKWNILKLKSNVKELVDQEGDTFEKKCHAMRRQFLARLERSIAEHYLPIIKD